MASSGEPGAPAARKHLRVLLPFSRNSLRIPDELAGEIGGGEALVVVPSGGKQVWPVEVGQDGDGAFLGRGWRAFADACGVAGGWLLVLRHRGRGVLTVKAFDDSGCLRELGTPIPPPAEGATGIKETARKPQFICVLPTDFMQKMLIPPKFVERYIPKEHLNNHMATILGPLGKVYTIQLKMDRLDLFFTGGLSKFVASHGIKEADFLWLRYEGNMSFTVKAFGPDGCQRECKHMDIRVQEKAGKQKEAPSACIRKNKRKNKASLNRFSSYEIGPPSWIRKQINFNALQKELSLAPTFCGAIGLQEPCTITLKTSMDSAKSWPVHGFQSKKGSYLLAKGWKSFCQENSLNEGDICTFNVIKTTLWHVVITRCKEQMNQPCYETTSASSKKRKIMYDRSGGKGPKRPKGSMTSLKKASSKKGGVFEIGPPAWIKKEIKTSTFQNRLYLSQVFCEAIGIHEACTVTLKTSMSSTKFWQPHVLPYGYCSHHIVGPDWTRFCHENRIRVGDVCTFNIVETTLWHVVIERCKEQETPSASSRKHMTKYDSLEGRKRPNGYMTVLNKAQSKKSGIFDIGPPAWIKKKINLRTIKNRLYLSQVFCEAIGIREACTITLKTSMSSTSSWHVRVLPYDYCSHHIVGAGWTRFCHENGIKVGDVCTFNIVQTTLWHVVITPQIS